MTLAFSGCKWERTYLSSDSALNEGQTQPQDVKSICNKFPREIGNLLKGTKH